MSTDKKPNFLFLFPDQHRPDWLGFTQNVPVATPVLDRLAREGMYFPCAVTPSPLCAPARAALAAGKHYDQCRVLDNGQDYPLDQPTYYQALRAAGYQVAGVGKFDLHKATLDWGRDGSRLLKEWGFTEGVDNEGKLDGSRSYLGNPDDPPGPYLRALKERGVADAYALEHADRQQYRDAYTTVVPDDLYCDNWLTGNGLDILKGFPEDEPWHLVVNFTGPHNPMDVTPAMRDRWRDTTFPAVHNNEDPRYHEMDHQRNRQNYAAMVENIDRLCGELIDAVRERGELENTIIVYASDHGEMLGDHGGWGKNTWRFASAEVPLIIAGPGVQKGKVCRSPVSLEDLAATFVDYAGAEPMPEMTAKSLRPVLEGTTGDHRDYVVSGLRHWRMVYDGRYKLVVDVEQNSIQLYDRYSDPWEDRDISADNPDIVRRLHKQLPENVRVAERRGAES